MTFYNIEPCPKCGSKYIGIHKIIENKKSRIYTKCNACSTEGKELTMSEPIEMSPKVAQEIINKSWNESEG